MGDEPMLRNLLAVASLTACSVHAAEYFVSPHGDDGSSGTTREEPFRTLKRAAEVFTGGDAITILPGVYHEGLEFRRFHSSDSLSTAVHYLTISALRTACCSKVPG